MRRPKRQPDSERSLPIEWTDRALRDLEAIGDYIAADNPKAAEHWIGEIVGAVEKIAGMPLAGRIVPELRRQDVREVLKRTYRIVYLVSHDRLLVLTVFEGRRAFPASD